MKLKATIAAVCASTAIALAATPASAAENWVLAADSATGNTRFLIDVQGFNYQVNRQGAHVFGAPLRKVAAGEHFDGYVVINAEGCLSGGGDMIFSFGKERSRVWWTPDGNRMYDGIGTSLCLTAAALREQAETAKRDVPAATNSNRSFSY